MNAEQAGGGGTQSAHAHGGGRSGWGARWGAPRACLTGLQSRALGICPRLVSFRGLLVFSFPPFPTLLQRGHQVSSWSTDGIMARSSWKTGAGSSDFRITTTLLSAAVNVLQGLASDSHLPWTPGTSRTSHARGAWSQSLLLLHPEPRAFVPQSFALTVPCDQTDFPYFLSSLNFFFFHFSVSDSHATASAGPAFPVCWVLWLSSALSQLFAFDRGIGFAHLSGC